MASLSVRTPYASRVTKGTYAGNDAANRAIPHGLGVLPYLVVIHNDASTYSGFEIYNKANLFDHPANGVYAVTVMDTTNFYVGNATDYGKSCNASGQNYSWVAFSN